MSFVPSFARNTRRNRYANFFEVAGSRQLQASLWLVHSLREISTLYGGQFDELFADTLQNWLGKLRKSNNRSS